MLIRVRTLWVLVGLVLAAAVGVARWCAPPPPRAPAHVDPRVAELVARGVLAVATARSDDGAARRSALAAEAVDGAYWLLDHPAPGFRDDCSGWVSAVFTRAGVPMDGVVATLWDLAVEHDALHWETVPRPGDLVFFDDTWDRNHNGKVDDPLTHVGLVVGIDGDGAARFAHAGTSAGRTIGRIDVSHPSVGRDGERLVNSALRRASRREPRGVGHLAGELWVGWATIDPALDWLSPAPFEDEWASDEPDEGN